MKPQRHWKAFEDRALLSVIDKYDEPISWDVVSSELIKLGIRKNPHQCKRRYTNHLSSNIDNRKLTFDEQLKLLGLFKQHGNSWKLISSFYEQRTDNIIKNTFFGMMRRCIRLMNKLTGGEMDNRIINVSKPNVILEFLLLKSDEGFSPEFVVFDCVEYYVNQSAVSIFHNFPEDMIMKAKHCVELFWRVKRKDDANPDTIKKIKKLKFFKKFYGHSMGEQMNSLDFGEEDEKEFEFKSHLLFSIKSRYEQLVSFFDKESKMILIDKVRIIDYLIGFLLFFRDSLSNHRYIRQMRVFFISKRLMCEIAVLIAKICNSRFEEKKLELLDFKLLGELINRLYFEILKAKSSKSPIIDFDILNKNLRIGENAYTAAPNKPTTTEETETLRKNV